jgi:hypothetical protein
MKRKATDVIFDRMPFGFASITSNLLDVVCILILRILVGGTVCIKLVGQRKGSTVITGDVMELGR